MDEYEEIDREIRSLLAQKSSEKSRPQHESAKGVPDILPLLESLNQTYTEINTCLKSGSAEALKDVLLKSDVKMSLVCETLLETLKKLAEEKRGLAAENSQLGRQCHLLEEREAETRVRSEGLRADLESKERNIQELSRAIKDQRDRMAVLREEAAKARSDLGLGKTRVEELENLRARAAEKLAVYEREMEAVRGLVRERDECIARLQKEKREEENRNSSAKTRVVELEQTVGVLNKKLEGKDLTLALCNEELCKVINENKEMKGDFDRYKEKSAYYESMYNNLNKQNAYLTSQLNKMLKSEEYNKDGATFVRKYRRRCKRYQRKVRILTAENEELKGRAVANDETVCSESSEALLKRVEELTESNRRSLRRISELEEERRRDNARRLEPRPGASAALSPAYPTASGSYRPRAFTPVDVPPRPVDRQASGVNSAAMASVYDRVGKVGLHGERALPTSNSIFSGIAPRTEVLSAPGLAQYEYKDRVKDGYLNAYKPMETLSYPKPNLDNDYQGKPSQGNTDQGASQMHEIDSIAGLGNMMGGFANTSVVVPSMPDKPMGLPLSRAEPVNTQPKPADLGLFDRAEPARGTPYKAKLDHGEESSETVKTYHTSSTLKNMMARTDKLQKRFESLEEQLANIKEEKTGEKLADKIKAYSAHCSELTIDSNDSDFL